MKVRLQSINGRIADPLYNEAMFEDAVLKAEKEGFDLIVFPSDTIRSESIGEAMCIETYREQLDKAYSKYEEFKKERKIEIVMDNGGFPLVMKSFMFVFNNNPEFEFADSSFGKEEELKGSAKAPDGDALPQVTLLCQGRGTESVCQAVYSNSKGVFAGGKALAYEFDADVLDYDFEQEEKFSRTPYLDGIDTLRTGEFFERLMKLQGIGLAGKLRSMKRSKIVIGVSGGLDSTVSLIVCAAAFKAHGWDMKDIIGVTMPGLGTTERTHKLARQLMEALGITIEDIDLRPLLKEHLKNIHQPEGKFDVTYEQCQSRERTQVLLDIANRENAVMIGTGCMSEFALGWMSYGGDHLSMYAVNVGLPKTVVKLYAAWMIEVFKGGNPTLSRIVEDVLDGPVSPELLPIDDKGEQHEKTESIIGDYQVLDFYIYHVVKNGFSLKRIFHMAKKAFPEYDEKTLLKWLSTFCLRFFTRQYKKNCYGDGLQLLSYSVSPFTGFGMPSDIEEGIWRKEILDLEEEIEG